MTRRLLTAVLALALAGGAYAAADEGSNALASTDASATVTLVAPIQSLVITNDGANPVWVYVWDGTETPAAITTAKAGARKINAGETFGWEFSGGADGGIGFRAFTHICGAGLTTTSRWIAK